MDYNSLITRLGTLLLRKDLAADAPGFIELCEANIRRDIRSYRQENRALIVHNERYLAKPADWLETILIKVQGELPMELLSKSAMQDKRADNSDRPGKPMFYRHSETAFELYPTPSGLLNIELEYMRIVPVLDDTNITTNWLMAENPDIYLYGSAVHAAPYLHDDPRIATWQGLYDAAVFRVNNTSDKAKWSGSGLRLRNRGMSQTRVPR